MILVLGASSYVGRYLYRRFGDSGAIATHNSTPIGRSVHFDASRMRLSEIVPESVDISHAFICFRAFSNIDLIKTNADYSYQVNVVGTKAVIDDLISLGIKPVFVSTGWVFDGEEGNYTEEDFPTPNTVYGTQKLEVEQYLVQACKDYQILRLGHVYGTDTDDDSMLSNWFRKLENGEEIICARDQNMSPIHVEDVALAAESAVSLDLSGLFNVCTTESCNRLDLLRKFIEFLQHEAHVVECSILDFDFADNRPFNMTLDPQKLIDATGLQFRSLESCFQEFLVQA